jgi:hypothetical protein
MKCEKPSCDNESLEEQTLCRGCAVAGEEKSHKTFPGLGVSSSGWSSPTESSAKSSDNQSTEGDSSTSLEALQKIRDTLNSLATMQCSDLEALKKDLAAAVKQLNVLIESFQHDARRASGTVRQTLLEGDLERERRRIEPIKPASPDGPHRITWKEDTGF